MIPVDNQWLVDQYPRGKDKKNAIGNRCNRPYKTLTVGASQECYLCVCDAWLPVSVGKINEFNKLEDIWNNPIAKELQQDVDSKKYTYCAIEHCGIVNSSILSEKYYIHIGIDDSCNLACPSCRTEIKNYTKGPEYEEKLSSVNHLVKMLNNFDKPFDIVLSGNGDVLASRIMRPLVLNWKPKKDQNITLFTNGLLMKKLLPKTDFLNHVNNIWISVDAGSKTVYENVRRPATYEKMRENLDWLAENRKENQRVVLKFTLQDANANDILDFNSLCEHYGYNGEITKLDNWNTWDDFETQDVVENLLHPLRNNALDQLKKIQFNPHIEISQTIKKYLK